MEFKVGDKVRVREDLSIERRYGDFWVLKEMEELLGKEARIISTDNLGECYTLDVDNGRWIWNDEMLRPIEDPLATKIEERNNKPVPTMQSDPEELEVRLREVFPEDNPIEPQHYKNGGKDLFDELYERLYHSKKTFTGREVFIIVMKFVAERYTRRYPNKNAEDLSKGIYTLERLKEYEEMEE